VDILDELKTENYRLGDFQALKYDRNASIFGESYLSDLYFALGTTRKKFSRSNLKMLFCGMNDLSLPAIIAYWNTQKLIILGKWEGDVFRTGGVCWSHVTVGTKRKSAFGAYGFLRWTWGTDDAEIMSWLGLAALFESVDRINGQRYADNHLTARFMERFGFRDCGVVPELLARGDDLADCIISSCSKETFVENLSKKIIESTL
jgi:hypothetical protein